MWGGWVRSQLLTWAELELYTSLAPVTHFCVRAYVCILFKDMQTG